MKWIKNFCLEILSKIKEHIASVIATATVGTFFLIISFVFKTYLTTVHTFILPLWGWITITAIVAGVPLVVVLIIEWLRKPKAPTATSTEKLLTNPDDIINSLNYWLHEQISFLSQKKVTRWYFSKIDNLLKLAPGSAKKHLPEAMKSSINNFRIEIVNAGEETILVRFCPPQIM